MRIALLASAAILMTGSVTAQPSAINYFGLNGVIESSSTLDLGLIRSAYDGEVVVYLAEAGALGRRIGSQPVHAGANPDVQVNVGAAPRTDVIAVLRVDGGDVATQRYGVNRSSGPQ